MLTPDTFMTNAAECGFSLYMGVPCSYLSPLIDCAIGRADVRHIGAANEGDAVAIASGAEARASRKRHRREVYRALILSPSMPRMSNP